MLQQFKNGIRLLDEFVNEFASKQQLALEAVTVDHGMLQMDSEPHLLEIRCSGNKVHVHLTTREIANCTIGAQHKLVMALMRCTTLRPA